MTSIARPLDPAFATNRAVMALLPVAAGVAAVLALRSGLPLLEVALAAALAAAAALGGWALARELAPDDNAGAFLSLGLALAAFLVVPAPSLLLLFGTVFLVRIVNRSTGLAARITDSIGLVVMAGWVALTVTPLFGLVAAAALAADAGLPDGLRRHWLFAALAAVGSFAALAQAGVVWPALSPLVSSMLAVTAFGFAALVPLTRGLTARGDASGVPLSTVRVRAGMVVGLLAALQALTAGSAGVAAAAPLWATLAGLVVARLRPAA